MISPGQDAVDFSLPDGNGRMVRLSDYRGKTVVLYFYPRDMTPGCTTEACGFRDTFPAYNEKDMVILGVSMDSQESHQKFAQKYHLPFPLLSDVDGKVCKEYGVYQKKKFYGKEFWGIKRMTFVIDKKGKVQKVFDRVKVESHHRDVLESL